MTTDVAVRHTVELTNEQLQYIAGTEFVPAGLRGNLPAIMACVATGRALGLADMTALRSIHIIDGKATFSAELMVMLVRQQGHSIQGTVTPERAEVIGKRADNGDTMTVEWTMEMAQTATYYVKGGGTKPLAGKHNWQSYPQAMLWARAVSQLCRMLFADCFAGATYTAEELEGSVGEPSADIPGVESRTDSAAAAQVSGESPASPTEQIAAAAEATGVNVDMWDDEIPFGDNPAPQVKYISDRQRTRLFTIASKAGVTEDQVREIVLEFTGQDSTKLIPVVVYDAVVARVEAVGA